MRKLYKLVRKIARAVRIANEAKANFDSAVCACAKVTRNNKDLAFVVMRVGAFGGPLIKQICRPDVVILSSENNYVVVTDGKVYELTVS